MDSNAGLACKGPRTAPAHVAPVTKTIVGMWSRNARATTRAPTANARIDSVWWATAKTPHACLIFEQLLFSIKLYICPFPRPSTCSNNLIRRVCPQPVAGRCLAHHICVAFDLICCESGILPFATACTQPLPPLPFDRGACPSCGWTRRCGFRQKRIDQLKGSVSGRRDPATTCAPSCLLSSRTGPPNMFAFLTTNTDVC